MSKKYLYRVFCTTEGMYYNVKSETVPIVCPNDGEPLNQNLTTIIEALFEEITSDGNIVLDAIGGACDIDGNLGVNIGIGSSDKIIKIGNSGENSRIFARYGKGGIIKHQTNPINLSDDDNVLTIADLLTQILSGTPTQRRFLTLPSASDVVTAISECEVGDSFDFSIINKSPRSNSSEFQIIPGNGGTIDGNDTISPTKNKVGSYEASGTGVFRLRIDNITELSESYTVYRIG